MEKLEYKARKCLRLMAKGSIWKCRHVLLKLKSRGIPRTQWTALRAVSSSKLQEDLEVSLPPESSQWEMPFLINIVDSYNKAEYGATENCSGLRS